MRYSEMKPSESKGRKQVPSTETRRYADLITLIHETVNDAYEEDAWKDILKEIWELANSEERKALIEFADWFNYVTDPEEKSD